MLPTEVIAVEYAIFGFIAGSFANMLAWRIPNKCLFKNNRSICPQCEKLIVWYDNIPVLSYIRLRGQCRYCGKPIPLRYLLLELFMGGLWASLSVTIWDPTYLWFVLLFSFILVTLSTIDIETGLLPNALTFPGIAAGIGFNVYHGDLSAGLIGAISGYVSFWLIAEAFRRLRGVDGMGYGDFKLMAMMGAFLGWQALPIVAFIASFSGLVVAGTYLMFSSRQKIGTHIPFGPFLSVGGMVYVVLSPLALGIIQ